MKHDFSKVTDSQRAQLFPIILSEHNPSWAENYQIEVAFIEDMLGQENIVRMNHYGSTAIPDLIAKPTIDILLEIEKNTPLSPFISKMENNGCVYLHQPGNPAPHMMFLRGYTPQGFVGQAAHIHVRYSGDWNELYFRDYLLAHPEIAGEYGRLKLQLEEHYKHDRDGYTFAKGEFIHKHTLLARTEFEGRYAP